MKNQKAYRISSKPIDVVILVARFRDILARSRSASGTTDYAMKLARKDPRAFVEGSKLFIKTPSAVRFTLASRAGDRQQYYPLGISFVRAQKSRSDDERLGFLNFPQRDTRADEQSLTIVDTYRDKAPGIRYKFSLYIQRGSDGAVGIIDPDILHTGDE